MTPKRQNSSKVDEVVNQEIEVMSCDLVRASARVANERIQKTLASSSKRKAPEAFEDATEADKVFVNGSDDSMGILVKRFIHILEYDNLELLEFHSYVFDKDVDTTENDVAVKMWSPILERLFRRTTLRTKWGESVGDSDDATSSSGFKVDLRVLKDTLSRRRKEADKANVEIAKGNASLIKVTSDRTKLHIESKVVLDKLIREVPEKDKNVCIPSLQLAGAKATLYSLKLGANGLYIAIKEESAAIPNHASKVGHFKDVLKLLFKFKNAIMNLASLSLIEVDDSSEDGSGEDGSSEDDSSEDDSSEDDSSSSNNNNNNNNNNNSVSTSWVRGTWIPPNSAKKTRLPDIPHVLYFSDSNSSN
ncbi:unnamed protein product [Rhizopus stolonifer]